MLKRTLTCVNGATIEHALHPQKVDAVLRQVRGNRAAAARLLGIDRNTLVRKLRQWERTDEGPEPADEEGL